GPRQLDISQCFSVRPCIRAGNCRLLTESTRTVKAVPLNWPQVQPNTASDLVGAPRALEHNPSSHRPGAVNCRNAVSNVFGNARVRRASMAPIQPRVDGFV